MRSSSISALRAGLHRLLDRVVRGDPANAKRHDPQVRLVPARRGGRLDRLKPADGYLTGDPETLVHLDWSNEARE